MWDPTCLVSPACEETRSIYRLSTPPTPLLDEPMPSPQKPSPAKERLQTITEVEVVKEVIVKKESRKVQSRSDLLAKALEQARISSPALIKSKAQSSPSTVTLSSDSSPTKSPPTPTIAKPKPSSDTSPKRPPAPAKSKPPKKKASSPPKVPIAPLAIEPGDGRPGRYTPSMERVVERAFATQPTDLIGVYGQATLTGKSMATMRDGELLTTTS